MDQHDTGRQLKTLETAIDILTLLKDGNGYDLATIASELDLAKSTIHGYLSTLEQHHCVYKDDEQFYIGTELLTLGGQVRHRCPSYQLVIEKVETVSEHTSERAQFIIEEGEKGVHLHVAKGNRGVKVDSQIGKQSYLHASAAGKTILAWSPDWKTDSVIERWGLPQLTENTITERESFQKELTTVREQGFAHNREESIEGLHSIGVPVKSEGDIIGAISVSGPSHRFTDEELEEEISTFLLGISNELELKISYQNKY